MSYSIEVYRGKIPLCRSLFDFSLFVAFFPQLVAGPIVKASEFLPQLQRDVVIRFETKSFLLILKGLFKKVIIADNIALLVDHIFASGSHIPSIVVWMGAVGFAIQIYCDFSGYTDMAIGVGRIFGFDLPVNFNKPYFAGNITEYWRRWHISLSTWINEYLYTPMALALRRFEMAGLVAAVMGTFFLVGLWHGASWSYVMWGLFHGVALAWDIVTKKRRKRIRKNLPQAAYHLLAVILTFIYICFSFIIFRAQDLAQAVDMSRSYFMFDFNFSIQDIGLGNASLFSSLFLMGVFVLLHVFSWYKGGIENYLMEASWGVKGTFAFATGVALMVFWPLAEAPFIYFQF